MMFIHYSTSPKCPRSYQAHAYIYERERERRRDVNTEQERTDMKSDRYHYRHPVDQIFLFQDIGKVCLLRVIIIDAAKLISS